MKGEMAGKPLRILAVINLPWDPRLGASRVWIELAEEWQKAGHRVEKYCMTDAFPKSTSSPGLAALRLLVFPFRAAAFIQRNAQRFDIVDALVGTLPFRKKFLGFNGLVVARSVGLFHLYDKIERMVAKRWPPASKGKISGRIFYRFFHWRGRSASRASLRHCDLLNLPNSDELHCLREEIRSDKAAIVQPYGLTPAQLQIHRAKALAPESRLARQQVCFLGMWSARKGAKDWGEIIRRVRTRVPSARFVFLGTMIDDRSVLNDLDLGTPDFIELVSKFQPDELPHLLSGCTVAAFPSYVEGFGLAVVEQLASGIPTVAYDAPGPRDILRELPELLVATGDVATFADKLIEILQSDAALYRDLCARSEATAARFSWPRIAADTIAEYRRSLDELTSQSRAAVD